MTEHPLYKKDPEIYRRNGSNCIGLHLKNNDKCSHWKKKEIITTYICPSASNCEFEDTQGNCPHSVPHKRIRDFCHRGHDVDTDGTYCCPACIPHGTIKDFIKKDEFNV